jgi:hypothetical protein
MENENEKFSQYIKTCGKCGNTLPKYMWVHFAYMENRPAVLCDDCIPNGEESFEHFIRRTSMEEEMRDHYPDGS